MKNQLRVRVHRYYERVWRRFWGERFWRRFPKGRGQEIQAKAGHWLHCLVSLTIGTPMTSLFTRMDEPNPRPEDLYKRPEELFHHPKPVPNYAESPSPPNKKRFQSNLGTHRGKKPWQVGVYQIKLTRFEEKTSNMHFTAYIFIMRITTKMAIASLQYMVELFTTGSTNAK